jgi:dipeptidyl aminopeptidase/acylaminoacyl peptidase
VYALVATPNGPRPIFGFPVVIVAHGYIAPDSYRTDGPEYMPYVQAMANHGYVVVKPDLRGHGQSWGVARGAYFSTDYNSDVLNLAASLRTYAPANAQSVGLFGHSMGGHIVLSALAAQPKRFKAAVIASGAVGDLDDMYYHWQTSSEAGTPAAALERQRVVKLFGAPQADSDFWKAVSPLNYAASITTPIQIHHGLTDAVVPPRFSQQLVAALTAAGHPPEYFTYAGTGHTYSGAAQADLIARSLQLFDRTLVH